MPLPTPPSKPGHLLPPDEYRMKSRPAARGAHPTAYPSAAPHETGDAATGYASAHADEPGAAATHAADIADTASFVASAVDTVDVAPMARAASSSAHAGLSAAANVAPPPQARARGKRRQTAALLQPVVPVGSVEPAGSNPASAAESPGPASDDAQTDIASGATPPGVTQSGSAQTSVRSGNDAQAVASSARNGTQTGASDTAHNGTRTSAPNARHDAQTRARDDAQTSPPAARGSKPATRPTPAPVAKPTATTNAPATSRRAAKKRVHPDETTAARKLFVLDTNVLMHDPSCLFRFEEHDVYLPMMTLEELDNHKKGMSEVARNARQVSRTLDALVAGTGPVAEGISLAKLGSREALGRLYFQTQLAHVEPVHGLPQGKADNQILGVVRALQRERADRQVVLVSKDINMRVKAHALGLPAEDYFNDQVLEDKDLLYSGLRALPPDFWTRHAKGMESWQDTKSGTTCYRVSGPVCASLLVNEFVYLEAHNGEPAFHAIVRELNGRTALLQTLRDYGHHKHNVWGITARNREQNFALNLLMNPDIDFVTLLGQAGTGKTLVALAAGLAQVLDEKRYNEIIVTRATVPVGEDIGFLPGTEEEKMQPWMGAFDDNLEVLQKTDDSSGEWGRAATQELIRSRLKVKSMNFMRGRTFVNKYLIIDEAQNLTPKQMKTLVTRAGPGTKIVCLGNIAQIDTPYLTEGSSGLTYVVDRFKGWTHGGHVTLARGERSRLADYASEIL